MIRRIGLTGLCLALLLACADTVPPSLEQVWTPENPKLSEHFRYVTVGAVPNSKMNDVAATLAEHYDRLLTNQGVEGLPIVTVKVWGDRSAFEAAFLAHPDGNAKFPTKLVGGYIDAADWEARFFNFDRPLGLTAVHEVTHLVSIAANPTIDNNPRWLWEAIAIYESGRPFVLEKVDLKCIGASSAPTLQELNDHPLNIYRVGSYLTQFVAETWGFESLRHLIKRNGDIQEALGISEQEFESLWHRWMTVDLSPRATVHRDC